jgi:phosphatidylglycerophosphatase A
MDRLVASGFGTGLILRRIRGSDAGSGTVGSLFALVIAVWVGSELGWKVQVAIAVVLILSSFWAGGRLAEPEGDASWMVIDEMAGTFVATVGLGLIPAVVAFVVFRVADIFKIPLVKEAEDWPGGYGITGDDVVAGFYGLAAGWLVELLIG